MATNTTAIYGIGVYGDSIYGMTHITVALPSAQAASHTGGFDVLCNGTTTAHGVFATGTADTDVIITADAVHTLVSVSAAVAQTDVGVVATATTSLVGVEATLETGVDAEGWRVFCEFIFDVDAVGFAVASVGDVEVTADSVLTTVSTPLAISSSETVTVVATALTEVEDDSAQTFINDVVVTADSVVPVEGVYAEATNTVTVYVIGTARLRLNTVLGVMYIGTNTVDAEKVVFDAYAFDLDRVAYTYTRYTVADRTAIVTAGVSRTAVVENTGLSGDRTVQVPAGEIRCAIVDVDSQSRILRLVA